MIRKIEDGEELKQGERKEDWAPPPGSVLDDPKQNEDLGIPTHGYTEAQKEKLRSTRGDPARGTDGIIESPNEPPGSDVMPEEELARIKRNTDAAAEGRNAELGEPPTVEDRIDEMKAEHGIPSHAMQAAISNQIDAERRKEAEKQQKEHDAAVQEALKAQKEQQPDNDNDDDDDDDDEKSGKKGRRK